MASHYNYFYNKAAYFYTLRMIICYHSCDIINAIQYYG